MFVSLVYVSPELLAEMNEAETPSPEDLLIRLEEALEEDPHLSFEDIFDIGETFHDY